MKQMYQADNILLTCMEIVKERKSLDLWQDFMKILEKLDEKNLNYSVDNSEINYAISSFVHNELLKVKKGSIIYCLIEENIDEDTRRLINKNLNDEEVEKLREVVKEIYE